jgi:hypothetical protein
MEGALIPVIRQLQQGDIAPHWLSLFSVELFAQLRSIYSTKSDEWKLNCVIQALIDLRRENKEGFGDLMRETESVYDGHQDEFRTLLDYISQHED